MSDGKSSSIWSRPFGKRANKSVQRLVAAALAGSWLGLTFCSSPTDAPLPSDAEQFSPPAIYSTWWNMTQACSGLTGSLGAVTWYKTSDMLRDPLTGDRLVGYWSFSGNRIVLVDAAMLDGASVRHEMLHSLLRHDGHPRNQFLGKCAGTVACHEACVRDAGPYPPPPEFPIHIGGDSLDLALAIEPRNPTLTNGVFFTITVMARNRSGHWATVTPALVADDTLRTLSFDVHGQNGGLSSGATFFDPSQRIFAPGEMKKMVFDFRIGDDPFSQQLPPGDYIVRGAFSDYWTSDSSFVIGP